MVDLDNIKNIAVIGGGIMGSGIAQVALLSVFEKVTLIDINNKVLENAKELIQKRIEFFESEEKFKESIPAFGYSEELLKAMDIKKKLTQFESVGIIAHNVDIEIIMSRLRIETDLTKGIKDADFIIEAVPEKLELKQDIFKILGEFSPPHTILASNTSSMSITEIGKYSGKPDKVIGMHFNTYYPIMGMVIEITPGEKSSEDSLEIGRTIAQRFPCLAGKKLTVQLEKETPGLIANRISMPMQIYFDWFLENAIDSGISLEELGPIASLYEHMDTIGLDAVYNVLKYFEEVVSPDFAPGKTFTNLVNSGMLGKKSGRGFFDYTNGEPMISPTPTSKKAEEFIEKNIDESIAPALNLNEACRLLEEGVVKGYRMINKVVFKVTYAPGPFSGAKENFKEWTKKLYEIAERTGKPYFKPCDMMESGRFLSLR
jgi:enoyl-CoA hydratase/3-hydroxyacyl-CoA dehydrogenase